MDFLGGSKIFDPPQEFACEISGGRIEGVRNFTRTEVGSAHGHGLNASILNISVNLNPRLVDWVLL